ncbi:MAG: hypothetical protein DMG22_15680 [Acidobacteria bacterium]|nr:MAG: hypothetical protein DMG22_15680 [Acidobacteriota bacterium]
MADVVPVTIVREIRECGFDEAWLQDYIWDNPSCLAACFRVDGLEGVMKERSQEGGGRLDLLLKDPDDETMYEVEVTLDETNADHIIRTIEYWDRERRKWPKRKHIAVLVAESITARFFNVIHLMSWAIPIVAVQANIVEANGQKSLNFTRVLDTYEEPEEPGDRENPEVVWRRDHPEVVELAETLLDVVRPVVGPSRLKFLGGYLYIGLWKHGSPYFWFRKSKGAELRLWLHDQFLNKGADILKKAGMAYKPAPETKKDNRSFLVDVDKPTIESKAEAFRALAELVKSSYQRYHDAEDK